MTNRLILSFSKWLKLLGVQISSPIVETRLTFTLSGSCATCFSVWHAYTTYCHASSEHISSSWHWLSCLISWKIAHVQYLLLLACFEWAVQFKASIIGYLNRAINIAMQSCLALPPYTWYWYIRLTQTFYSDAFNNL